MPLISLNDERMAKIVEGEEDLAILRQHLKEVIEGTAFRGSHRSGQFLRYVVDQAIAGLPSAHPMLLRMLMTVESICSSHADVDLSYPDVRTLLRHLALLPFPLTPEVLHVAIRHHCLTV